MDRFELLAQAETILAKANYTKEDSAKVASLIALADAQTDRSDLRRAIVKQRAGELGRTPLSVAAGLDPKFTAYLREGPQALSLEERRRIGPERIPPVRGAVQTVGTGSAGGVLVPASFADRLFTFMKLTDEIFQVAQLWESETGAAFNYPLVDDTGSEAAVIVEAAPSNSGPDVSFAAISFDKTRMFRTGIVLASVELAQDSYFNLDNLLSAIGGVRLARGAGAAAVTALLSAALVGVTAAATGAIAPDEIYGLIDSLDEAYAGAGQASFLMKRSTLTALQKLKTTTNAYIFPPDRDASGRQQLCGFPVYFSPSGNAMTAGLKPITFGRHDLCVRRDVKNSLTVRVFVERFAAAGQIGYETYLRTDFGVPVSGTNCPIRSLQMHA